MFLLNGEVAETLSLEDRGLMYGDGLFETIAVRNQQLEFWQRHMQRLHDGCQRLNIPTPDPQRLLAEARQLISGQTIAVLKIIITRGQGGRGYRAPELAQTNPSRVHALYDWPDYPNINQKEGVILRYCRNRLGINVSLAGIKHLNRLEQVLARSEWNDETISEGLMLDSNDYVIEGTMSNLFFVKDGTLLTPDLSNSGVAGIMRDVIQEIAHKNHIPLEIGYYLPADINNADELFISNSLIGIWPVRQLEQQHYPVGPITQKIIAAVNADRITDESHEAI